MIASRLKKLRKEKGISQLDVSMALDVSRSAIAAYESGHRIPSYEVARKLAEYYNVDYNYIYDDNEGTPLTKPVRMVHDIFGKFGYDLDDLSKEEYDKVQDFLETALKLMDMGKEE